MFQCILLDPYMKNVIYISDRIYFDEYSIQVLINSTNIIVSCHFGYTTQVFYEFIKQKAFKLIAAHTFHYQIEIMNRKLSTHI